MSSYWIRSKCACFCRSKDPYGDLSNMTPWMPIRIHEHPGAEFKSSEALYQAIRFPDRPDLQLQIMQADNAFSSKKIAVENYSSTRSDWGDYRILAMEFTVLMKLKCNFFRMSQAYRETGKKPIVEFSNRDDFWGAKPNGDNCLFGANHLGRIHSSIRSILECQNYREFDSVPVPDNLVLFGVNIQEQKIHKDQHG